MANGEGGDGAMLSGGSAGASQQGRTAVGGTEACGAAHAGSGVTIWGVTAPLPLLKCEAGAAKQEAPPVLLAVLGASTAALWPLLAFVAFFWLRAHIRDLLDVLLERMRDKNQNVSVGSLSFTKVQEGQLETLGASITQLSQLAELRHTQPPADIPARLDELAETYETVKLPQLAATVRRKNELGSEMGALITVGRLDRRRLVAAGKDAYLTAIAFAVLADPKEEDVELLCLAAKRARRKHPRYSIARALDRLAQARMVARPAEVLDALQAMNSGPDAALAARLASTRASVLALE